MTEVQAVTGTKLRLFREHSKKTSAFEQRCVCRKGRKQSCREILGRQDCRLLVADCLQVYWRLLTGHLQSGIHILTFSVILCRFLSILQFEKIMRNRPTDRPTNRDAWTHLTVKFPYLTWKLVDNSKKNVGQSKYRRAFCQFWHEVYSKSENVNHRLCLLSNVVDWLVHPLHCKFTSKDYLTYVTTPAQQHTIDVAMYKLYSFVYLITKDRFALRFES